MVNDDEEDSRVDCLLSTIPLDSSLTSLLRLAALPTITREDEAANRRLKNTGASLPSSYSADVQQESLAFLADLMNGETLAVVASHRHFFLPA